jgi:hypothetical protein
MIAVSAWRTSSRVKNTTESSKRTPSNPSAASLTTTCSRGDDFRPAGRPVTERRSHGAAAETVGPDDDLVKAIETAIDSTGPTVLNLEILD